MSETNEPREVLVLGRWPGWLGVLRGVVLMGLAVGCVAAGLLAYRTLVATAERPQQRPQVERARPVEVVIAERARVTPRLVAYGQVAASRTVDLRALVGGEVREVSPGLVDGGLVAAGDVLLSVDAFPYEGALVRARSDLAETEARQAETSARIVAEREALESAEDQQRIADREVVRLTSLQRSGAASAAQFDAARLRQSSAAAVVDQRRNAILVLEAQAVREGAALERLKFAIASAERDLAQTALRAPFAGLLSNVGAEVGRLLNQNDRVATLVALDPLEVRFGLSDAEFARLEGDSEPLEGRRVDVTWRSGATALVRAGRIARVAPSVNARDGGFDVIARLDAGEGAAMVWRPGAFVEVELDDRSFDQVVRIPQSALFTDDVVYVVNADRRLEPVGVARVGFDGDHVLIDGPIAEGASLLATRLADAGPGVLVAPRPADANGGPPTASAGAARVGSP
jgi:RND family efflux transporter MFP subunit